MTPWLTVTRLLTAILQDLARSGIVWQEPALHAVLPKALGARKALHLQVPLLAKGGQLLACEGEQETRFYTKTKGGGVRLGGVERRAGEEVSMLQAGLGAHQGPCPLPSKP